MIAFPAPDRARAERPRIAEVDRHWATARLLAAIDAVLRRWPRGSERALAGLLRAIAEHLGGPP